MRQHPETNPYFHPQQHSRLPVPTPQHEHGGQRNQPHQEPHPQTEPSGMTLPQGQDQNQSISPIILLPTQRPTNQPPIGPWGKLAPQDRPTNQPPIGAWGDLAPQDRPTNQPPIGAWGDLAPQDRHGSAPKTQLTRSQGQEPAPHSPPQYTGARATQPPKHQRHERRQSPPEQQSHRRHIFGRAPRRTKLHTWFLAGFCAIFWLVIILGGIIVLIVYLVFRPHSPSFEVSSVTLNAAYLDVDVLLNADLTVLAKFINPNKKVRVDFSYVVLDLYYGNTLISSQYIEPFRAARLQTRLASVHMVTSQVQLPSDETERLKREIEENEIMFQVKGVFRARSNLGSFLRYSYRLYGHCTIKVTNPPGGVLKAVKCKTKR